MGNKWQYKGMSDLPIGDELNNIDPHIVVEDNSDSWQAQRILEEQRHIEHLKSFSEIKKEVSQIVSGLEEVVFLLEDIRRILQEKNTEEILDITTKNINKIYE